MDWITIGYIAISTRALLNRCRQELFFLPLNRAVTTCYTYHALGVALCARDGQVNEHHEGHLSQTGVALLNREPGLQPFHHGDW